MSEEEIRKSFGHLRLLECVTSSHTRCQIWKVLPHLDIVRNVQRFGLALEDFLEDDDSPRERKCLHLTDDANSNWIFCSCPDFSFSSIRFLELSCLEKTWVKNEVTPNASSTLESLVINLLHPEASVGAILREYGANLRRLFINGFRFQNIQLGLISELCPRLEAIHLKLVGVNGISQSTSFRHLKEFIWAHSDFKLEASLSAVFSCAPNLQKVQIEGQQFNLNDLQQVKILTIEEKILGSLQSLRWKIGWCTSAILKGITEIVKNASAILPELRELELSYENTVLTSAKIAHSVHGDSFRNEFFRSMPDNGLSKAMMADKILVEVLKSYK
ncbi:uncharacterized protein LOC135935822 [Cloeon dipterum]|uniref:uncharacterized protein LOC135935822 n=1 Tax=Cloeon dipterum TaxID=197152 RepID=UPI00321FEB3C